MSKSKSTLLRKTLITGSLIGLVALFFVMNYLVFIPRQQKSYNKKIFRILHEQIDNLDTIISAHSVSFGLSMNANTPADDTMYWDNNYLTNPGRVKFINKLKQTFKAKRPLFQQKKESEPTGTISFIRDSVLFKRCFIHSTGDTTCDSYSLAFGDILEPIQAMHENIFDYIILIQRSEPTGKQEDLMLYKSPNLDVDDYKLNFDSIYKNTSHVATARDTAIEGIEYKFFLLPFRFHNKSLFYGGFIEERNYKSKMSGSSYPIILLIGSLLIIIIISLPFLKIYFLGRHENITIADMRLLMAAFLAGPAFFILALSTLHTYYYTNNMTNRFLDSLHQRVKYGFYKELSSAVDQLKSYNDILNDPLKSTAYAYYDSAHSIDSKKNADSLIHHRSDHDWLRTKKGRLSFKDLFFYPSKYKILDGVSWTDASGRNVAKWNFLDTQYSYLNLEKRQYFQDIKEENYDTIGREIGNPDSLAIQPTLSWANGVYTVNIAMPSRQIFTRDNKKEDTAIMISLSSSMYSVCYPVVPKGFNFCIVNEKGDILFHSQTNRGLHENLFDELDNNADVKSAVLHKDSVLISGITLYDHQVKMLITPLQGLKYYLVTYYNIREQNLFVFHIAAFTMFAIAMLLIALLFFLLSYFLSGQKFSSAFIAVRESDWMAPSPFKNPYYKTLIYFQRSLLLILSLLFIFILSIFYPQLYWYILQCTILLPFFATTGYYIIRRKSELNFTATENKTDQTVPASDTDKKDKFNIRQFLKINSKILYWYFSFLFLFFIFNIAQYDSSNRTRFNIVFDIGIILIAVGVPFLAAYSCYKRPPYRTSKPEPTYLSNYDTAVFLVIILISILPTFGFFYYGFKKEELLRVKSRQVYLAEGIKRKADNVNTDIKRRKLNIAPFIFGHDDSVYIHNLAYAPDSGIYITRGYVSDAVFTIDKDAGKKSTNPDLYQLVTKFLFLPPDHTDFFHNTSYYHWEDNCTDSIILFYLNTAGKKEKNAIKLSMPAPHNAMLLQLVTTSVGWLLLIGLVLFLIVHYKLIIPLAKRIFLIDSFDMEITKEDKQWINNIFGIIVINKDDESFYGCGTRISYNCITKKEDEQSDDSKHGAETILKIQNQLLPAYDRIWEKCTAIEKFILYDFAVDGFTNYKNADILFKLYHRAIIRKDPKTSRLIIMTHSFRNYILSKSNSDEIQELRMASETGGTWKNLKNIFFVLLFAVIIYLFVAQEEITNKLLIIIPGIVTLLPSLLKLFDKNFLGAKGDSEK